jgi:hypothetical protein
MLISGIEEWWIYVQGADTDWSFVGGNIVSLEEDWVYRGLW